MSFKDLLPKTKAEQEKDLRKNTAIAATIGIAVGAAAGVLLAPKAGKETRQEIAANTQEMLDKVKEFSANSQEAVVEAKEELTEEAQQLMRDVKKQAASLSPEKPR